MSQLALDWSLLALQVNPTIKKEKWSPAEDERLLILYEEHGGSWAQISRHLEASVLGSIKSETMIVAMLCGARSNPCTNSRIREGFYL